MKAYMTMTGTIVIEPESGLEAYAMRHWVNHNMVNVKLDNANENMMWRGSGLQVVSSEAPPEPQGANQA